MTCDSFLYTSSSFFFIFFFLREHGYIFSFLLSFFSSCHTLYEQDSFFSFCVAMLLSLFGRVTWRKKHNHGALYFVDEKWNGMELDGC